MAQKLKNPPTKPKTQVQSLAWEDPLQEETATHSSILAWRISWTVACQAPLSMESQESDMTYRLNDHHHNKNGVKITLFISSQGHVLNSSQLVMVVDIL